MVNLANVHRLTGQPGLLRRLHNTHPQKPGTINSFGRSVFPFKLVQAFLDMLKPARVGKTLSFESIVEFLGVFENLLELSEKNKFWGDIFRKFSHKTEKDKKKMAFGWQNLEFLNKFA